jgi:hypothetical protein
MLGFRRTAVNHPTANARAASPRRHTVTVVGGGIAGVAAAMVLAERGATVTLLEANAELGGRVSAWTDTLADGQRFEMERGFHAFFRQYYNLRALLRRIDPTLARLTPVTDYPLLGPDGAVESFAGLPKLPIVNLISLIRRSSSMTLREALRVDNTLGQAMMAYDPVATYANYDHLTAREFLDRLGFPPRARQMLFDVFSHSFFNPEDEFSAAELMMMFHFYFIGNPEGIVFDVLDGPFSTRLWQPMQRHLAQLGAQIQLGTTVTRIARDGAHMQVHTNTGCHTADAVILAPHLPGLQRIVAASPELDAAWSAPTSPARASPTPSPCGACGSIVPAPQVARPSSAPPASASSTTSPSTTCSRTRAAAGPRAPAAASSSSTPTPSPPASATTRSRPTCSPPCICSTPRHAPPACSKSATWSARTAPPSAPARPPCAPASPPRSPASCSPATSSTPTSPPP